MNEQESAAWLGLVTCSSGESGSNPDGTASHTTTEAPENPATEEATYIPRLAIISDGGIQVLDAGTLETVGEFELDGFNRLDGAGDGRHLLVSTSGGFQVLFDHGSRRRVAGDEAVQALCGVEHGGQRSISEFGRVQLDACRGVT